MKFDNRRRRSASADGLDCHCACSAEEVNSVHSFDGGADEIEYGFADSVFHWPDAVIAGVLQLAPAKFSADDAQPQRFLCGRFAADIFTAFTAGTFTAGIAGRVLILRLRTLPVWFSLIRFRDVENGCFSILGLLFHSLRRLCVIVLLC